MNNPNLEKPDVVFVVAHPDDVAFSMGGTAWLLKDAYKLHVICASKGERGYPGGGPGLKPPRADVGAIREAEEQAACALLGADLTFLGLVDGEIYPEPAACERVAEMLGALKPRAVFGMGPMEKPDHAAVSLLARRAMEMSDRFWKTEYYYPVRPGETRNAKFADIYVNITDVIEQKRVLVRCHRHQVADEAAVERVIDRDRQLGGFAYCQFAEAYCSELPIIARRWEHQPGAILLDLPLPASRTNATSP